MSQTQTELADIYPSTSTGVSSTCQKSVKKFNALLRDTLNTNG
jgi:peroxiredoxin